MLPSKILITEDEVLIARILESTLTELGYTVVAIAQDGKTSLQKVAETQPDLVLMDIVLPGRMDGIEVADEIRKRFHIPVVYLTAYADNATLNRAKITEPFGYILKPFEAQDLHTSIQIALMRHSVEQMKLNTLRQNISATLPHEINTPLTGIFSSVELLTQFYDLLSKDEVMEQLQTLQSTAQRLNQTCQKILFNVELEVLANNPQRFQSFKNEVTVATQNLIEDWADKKAGEFDRQADLKLNLQKGSVHMFENYFKRLVEEILDNAFKFSDSGTPVEVESGCVNNQFCLRVSDRSRGMTPEQLANLGAFNQFDRSLHEQQGLGLGLNLVRRLVELHHGKATIDSAPEMGTVVEILLPGASS